MYFGLGLGQKFQQVLKYAKHTPVVLYYVILRCVIVLLLVIK